ncbi:hypothetical protein FKM82_014130 [Ascaphus truei]
MGKHLLVGLTLTCVIIAIVTCTPAQFDDMIKVTTVIYGVANFTDYGCHCGPSSQGMPVDSIDW